MSHKVFIHVPWISYQYPINGLSRNRPMIEKLTLHFILSPIQYTWLAPKIFDFLHQGDLSGFLPKPFSGILVPPLEGSGGPSDLENRWFSELTGISD